MASMTGGAVVWTFYAKTGEFNKALDDSSQKVKKLGDDADSTGKRGESGFLKMGAAIGAVAGIAQTIFTKAIDGITASVGDAIKRVDTLNNASRSFANMGFSAAQTNKVMKDLDMSIRGLPTSLDEAVRGVQILAASTGDIDKSRKVYSALNDAIIGFGGSADMVQSAVVQLSQDLGAGRVTAQTWLSLTNSGLTPALAAMARQMGITTQALKEGLGNGTISVEKFQDALIQLDAKGGGGMASFQKIALDATSGISTGWKNAQTAITRGIASIIQAIGSENISGAISSSGKVFEKTLKGVASVIKTTIQVIKQINGWIQRNATLLRDVAVVIGTLLMPQLIKLGIQGVRNVILYTVATVQAGIQSLIAGAQMAAAWLLALGPIGLIIAAVAAAAALIFFHWDKVKKFLVAAGKVMATVFITLGKVLLLPFLPLILTIKFVIDHFNEMLSVVTTVFGAIWAVISPVLNFIKNLFIIVFGAIAIVVLTVLTVIKDIVFSVFNFIWGIISKVLGFIWDAITFYFDLYKKIVVTEFTIVKNFVSAAWNAIFNTIKTIVTALIDFFRPAFSWLVERGKDIIRGLVNGIKAAAGLVTGAIKAASDKIGQFFAGAGKWLYDVGRAIVQGLVNGIKSMVSAVNNAAGDIGNAVKNKVKGLLGIGSPSKLMRQYGEWTVQGFAQGIDKGNEKLAAIGTSLANASVNPTIMPAVGNMEMAGGGGSQVVNHIGTINIASEVDGENWLKRLTRDEEVTAQGLTPYAI